MIVDAILFVFGIIVFYVYITGQSSIQNVFAWTYWLVMAARYVIWVVWDSMKLKKMGNS